MAFEQESVKTPVDIGRIKIDLFSSINNETQEYDAGFEIEVIFDSGDIKMRRGNLIPHITTA